MSDFDRDPRRKQELVGRPIADILYRQVFGDGIEITRMERTEQAVLDIRFAIDVQIALPTGNILLGQEKFLSHEYAHYRSVTVEHLQNQFTGEHGDWFKLAPQIYFVGYFTEDNTAFWPWVLLNWANVVIATLSDDVPWMDNNNRNGRAKASFRYCPMSAFPSWCVVAGDFARKQREAQTQAVLI